MVAEGARIYSLCCGPEDEVQSYWDFRIPHHRASLWENLPEFDQAARSG